MSPGATRFLLFGTAALVGVVVTLALTVIASALVGQKVVAIDSASMEPTLADGDVVVARRVDPADVEPGELITFSAPGSGRTLTRRVQGVVTLADAVVFEVKADAVAEVERFSVPLDGEVAEPRRRIPLVGGLWDSLPWPGLLLVVPLGVLLVLAVRALSRRLFLPSVP